MSESLGGLATIRAYGEEEKVPQFLVPDIYKALILFSSAVQNGEFKVDVCFALFPSLLALVADPLFHLVTSRIVHSS